MEGAIWLGAVLLPNNQDNVNPNRRTKTKMPATIMSVFGDTRFQKGVLAFLVYLSSSTGGPANPWYEVGRRALALSSKSPLSSDASDCPIGEGNCDA